MIRTARNLFISGTTGSVKLSVTSATAAPLTVSLVGTTAGSLLRPVKTRCRARPLARARLVLLTRLLSLRQPPVLFGVHRHQLWGTVLNFLVQKDLCSRVPPRQKQLALSFLSFFPVVLPSFFPFFLSSFLSSFLPFFLSFFLSILPVCLFVHKVSGSYVHACPRPCVEHLSVGQAFHTPTQSTAHDEVRALALHFGCFTTECVSSPWDWAALHWLAHAAGHGHFQGAFTSGRSVPVSHSVHV